MLNENMPQIKVGLHPKTKFIRTELLKPGDVILSRPMSTISKAIAVFSMGSYSHASLVVSPILHFEATSLGLGYTAIPISKIEINPSLIEMRHLWDVSQYRRIDVFRHSNAELLFPDGSSKIIDTLTDILTAFNGCEYPSLRDLAHACHFLKKYPTVKQKVLDSFESKMSGGSKKIVPGQFCSQLVATCLAHIGMDVFGGRLNSWEVNPNDLANQRISLLRPVPGVKCNADDTIPNSEELMYDINSMFELWRDRNQRVSQDVQIRQLVVMIKQLGKRFDTLADEYFDSFSKNQGSQMAQKGRDPNLKPKAT